MRRRGKEIQGSEPVQRRKEEEERKFTDSEPFKEEKEQLPVYFRISKRINTKTESIQGFPKNQIKIPDKAR